MTDINSLVLHSENYYIEMNEIILDPEIITEAMKDVVGLPLRKISKPKELKDGEYAVPMKDKLKEKRWNPRTGRKKKFKTTKWMTTTIKPEDRTLKNLPRYSDKKPKVRFQDWLQLTRPTNSQNSKVHSVGRSPNGNWYGWSHRAIGEFGIGKEIKQGTIGNKFEYGEKIDKEYEKIARQSSYDIADKWRKDNCKFEPYVIKTDEEAMEHAIRFAKDVS